MPFASQKTGQKAITFPANDTTLAFFERREDRRFRCMDGRLVSGLKQWIQRQVGLWHDQPSVCLVRHRKLCKPERKPLICQVCCAECSLLVHRRCLQNKLCDYHLNICYTSPCGNHGQHFLGWWLWQDALTSGHLRKFSLPWIQLLITLEHHPQM